MRVFVGMIFQTIFHKKKKKKKKKIKKKRTKTMIRLSFQIDLGKGDVTGVWTDDLVLVHAILKHIKEPLFGRSNACFSA
jgi:hypothetical protein